MKVFNLTQSEMKVILDALQYGVEQTETSAGEIAVFGTEEFKPEDRMLSAEFAKGIIESLTATVYNDEAFVITVDCE